MYELTETPTFRSLSTFPRLSNLLLPGSNHIRRQKLGKFYQHSVFRGQGCALQTSRVLSATVAGQADSPSVSSWLTPALVSLKELQVDLGGSISEDQNPLPPIFLRKTNHSSQASVRTHPKPCTCSTRLPAALIRVSIAVRKYHEQKQLWRKGIISSYMSHPQSS